MATEKSNRQPAKTSPRPRRTVQPSPAHGLAPEANNVLLEQALADPQSASPAALLTLQRNAGNRAVQRLLDNRQVQAKLTVGPAGDQYEQEADRVASSVMRMADPSPSATPLPPDEIVQSKPITDSISPLIRRQEEEEDEEEGDEIQTKRADARDGFDLEAGAENRLQSMKGGGSPLPSDTRGFMENRFGAGFDNVRVHTDSAAVQMNRDIHAQAFTHGPDIYFGSGKYNPGTHSGKQLLAHELTHVVQQGGASSKTVQGKSSNSVIQASLLGSRNELVEFGGEVSKKGKKNKSSYSKIIIGLEEYEAWEQEGNKSPEKLIKKLAGIRKLIVAWLNKPNNLEKDPARAVALRNLLTRVNDEWGLLGGDQAKLVDETKLTSSSFGSLAGLLREIWLNRQPILANTDQLPGNMKYSEIYAILTGTKKPTGQVNDDVQGHDDPDEFMNALGWIEANSVDPNVIETRPSSQNSIEQAKQIFHNRLNFINMDGLNDEQREMLTQIANGEFNRSDPEIDEALMTNAMNGPLSRSEDETQKQKFIRAFYQAKEIFSLQGGFTYFKRRNRTRGDLKLYRIYLNVMPWGATTVIEAIVRVIVSHPETYPGVKEAKVAGPRAVGKRHDSIVIYIGDQQDTDEGPVLSPVDVNVQKVITWLKQYHASEPNLFSHQVGALQEPIAPGIGLGVDPNQELAGGDSFNMVRAKAIYAALQDSTDQQAFVRSVQTNLLAKGVNFFKPHENL